MTKKPSTRTSGTRSRSPGSSSSARRRAATSPPELPGLYDDPRADRRTTDSGDLPPGWVGRGRIAWRDYGDLRQRARYDSGAWWWFKIVQGALTGGLLVMLGVLVALGVTVMGGSVWVSRLGIGLIAVGALVFVRYLAAPLTCRWIVTVPENWYFVVEDADGYTLEYLEAGRLLVPFRWNAHVRPYVDFSSVVVNEEVEDVLDSDALPVDIEVSVLMQFNPVEADPDLYASLRKLTTPEQFEAMLSRDIRDIVRKHLNMLDPVHSQETLHNVMTLEAVIVEQLEGRAAMGLVPALDRPVTVHVHAPEKVKEAYQSLWARTARVREESQTLRDIKDLANELGVPFEEAFQLFYIMQRGLPPTRSVRRTSRSAAEPLFPPLYVIQQPERTPESPAAAADTAELDAVEILPEDEPPVVDDWQPPRL
ncbi:MAG: hypothetical protein JXJ20_11815, partial [Anaerolineae bacterium]|nr:hypothetical protein [Anaerolineae bacterium]